MNSAVPLIDAIDALLPQTQCQRCGYSGCKPYAEAITRDEADINQCPPGGTAGVHRLAALLGREFKPLSPLHGLEMPKQVALVDEASCIGCTLCIQACPVDAIVGANKLMHTVIAGHCTGCELCLPPCPVDCIALISSVSPVEQKPIAGNDMSAGEKAAAEAARERYTFRQFRLAREAHERAERLAALSVASRRTNDESTQTSIAVAKEAIGEVTGKIFHHTK